MVNAAMQKRIEELEDEESQAGRPLDKDLEAIREAIWNLHARGYNVNYLAEFVKGCEQLP